VGVVLINVINRAYAKKVLVQLPGQVHPLHFHKLKEETFLVLWGELITELDGRERVLKPGDTPDACSRRSRPPPIPTIRCIAIRRSMR
jgi:mannose-6-phosphate isomerase-like protein (cupin superfamily)